MASPVRPCCMHGSTLYSDIIIMFFKRNVRKCAWVLEWINVSVLHELRVCTMLITPSTGKGQKLSSQEKKVVDWCFSFCPQSTVWWIYWRCRVSVLRIASFPVTSLSIRPKDNIQIQADLEDQARERRNLEGGYFIPKFKVAAPSTPLPRTPIIGRWIIGIRLSN